MNEQTKLILALLQVNNLTELLAGNQYENYMFQQLITLKVELERQLSHYASS
jgi:tagatose-1,6-bisphosphate aldolase